MKIKNFDNYVLNENLDVVKLNGKLITKQFTTRKTEAYKMKTNNGDWTTIARSKILYLANIILKLPKDAVKIYDNYEYYIDRSGNIYSFTTMSPNGKIIKCSIGSNGYPKVNLFINKLNTPRTIHSLLCDAFILKDYTKQGLCCLHKDDNKLNYNLNNLSVGTYSMNNKDAYLTGCNPRKKNILD